MSKSTNFSNHNITPMAQSKTIDFKGQNIYIGIDVHLSTWSVTILTESGYKRRHAQKASAAELFEHLTRHYPHGTYRAVYEAGFSGFATYYALTSYGIECMVIHPADVPTTQYESVMKSDSIDSDKLARALKANQLKGIHIRSKENLDDLGVIRLRKTLQIQLSGYKSRVKHLLHRNGVELPPELCPRGSCWSKRFIRWLKEDVSLLSSSRNTLDLLLEQVELLRSNLLKIDRQIRLMSRREPFAESYELLISIPGIGMMVAMSLLTEIDDIGRFHNEKQFASYLGLVPTCHSTGDKVNNGEKTFRGNKQLGPLIVESAWVMIRQDRTMGIAYGEYLKRMKPQEAIIRIARRLSNRILSILKSRKIYEYDKCVH